MEKIIRCQFKGKDGYQYAEGGKCYTHNKNEKSRRKAYYLATLQMIEKEHEKQ